MPLSMMRGKNEVMYNYLPGYTFDFEKYLAIARINYIRGIERNDLNHELILRSIRAQVHSWGDLAGVFLNPRADQFVFLEPKKVYAELFPKVFWCQNPRCHRIVDYSQSETVPAQKTCPVCHNGRLAQLRFVKIHQCGEIQPLVPPYQCEKCHTRGQFALDDRKSEHISQFVWICGHCGHHSTVFAGPCRSCDWVALSGVADGRKKLMSIEPHRANRVFYPQYAVLLNQPGAETNRFLGIDGWQFVAAGFYIRLPELDGLTIEQWSSEQSATISNAAPPITQAELEQFHSKGYSDEQIDLLRRMTTELSAQRQGQQKASSPQRIAQSLLEKTKVRQDVWTASGQELLESALALQSDQTQDLFALPHPNTEQSTAQSLAVQLGLSRLSLASDFPMTHATFAYSRAEFAPRECRLNPFPPDAEHQGKFPIFVDTIQADALVVSLDHRHLWRWLKANNVRMTPLPKPPPDSDMVQRAHFVELFSDLAIHAEPIELTQTLTADQAEARMVFGLIHTMSHLFLRQAALLCGLERESLAEYVLPKALTFAIYANHRFGATIGALSSLFEQSLPEWLGQISLGTRRCIYDPVCASQGGSCHACAHLAEISCRFFNLNLARPFLFGGHDKELGDLRMGYWDGSLNE
jgi:hypothetical protein